VDTKATYRIIGGPDLRADAVTERLGVSPSSSYETGHLGRSGRPSTDSGWFLESCEHIEEGVELEVQIDRLLTSLEPVGSELWRLVDDGYWVNWWCFVGSHGLEHAVELNRDLLARLLLLPGDLWLDLCEPLSPYRMPGTATN